MEYLLDALEEVIHLFLHRCRRECNALLVRVVLEGGLTIGLNDVIFTGLCNYVAG